ncbi:hypothetical protein LEM8419_00955 [Neolewinella maritima]|uniref:DUF4349 domain-containing protein n=1 Tax=Neolewinella maritima TaxID=1383882 RepID=A0ABN8F4G2_9BACT|nr:DUF4349 domain-containing protein [Neolewinella maritima]CAH0999655.1 hypothetical protein LEM8419_00955 [Neolewinella maritima]
MRSLLLLCFTLLLCTCDRAPETAQAISKFEGVHDARAGDAPPDQPLPTETDQQIIYTASARAEVADLDSALAQLNALLTQRGGFVASQHRSNSPYELQVELVLRLPADRLQPVLDALPRLTEHIDYQNLDSRNVTEEWLDLESRLETKREVRDRYIEILRQRAEKVEDILNAEEKIRRVTEEIEAQEGRLRYLRDRVSYSTLTLVLYQTQDYRDTGTAYQRGFWNRVGSAAVFGWELIQELVLGLISIWPIVLLTAVLVALWRRRRGRRNSIV